jgi:uncharacterized SAM-binding protein YcdF (DUF218 family)
VQLRSVPWRRVGLITGIGLLVLFLVWVIGGYFLLVRPHVNHPQHADAILMLGPPDENNRVETALTLLNKHVASSLVISVPAAHERASQDLCTKPQIGFTVTCFRPHPATTRGEVEEMRRLAEQHGWKSIVVVTSTFHISRARMIVKRCFQGQVYMVPARKGISVGRWIYEYFYQTGGYVKAILHSGC